MLLGSQPYGVLDTPEPRKGKTVVDSVLGSGGPKINAQDFERERVGEASEARRLRWASIACDTVVCFQAFS